MEIIFVNEFRVCLSVIKINDVIKSCDEEVAQDLFLKQETGKCGNSSRVSPNTVFGFIADRSDLPPQRNMLLVSIIFTDDTNVTITSKNVDNVCTHMSKWLTVDCFEKENPQRLQSSTMLHAKW